ncbi:hypothetical protein ACTFIZ_001074 [Dictyostelium cf. discoideum]
MVNAIAIIKGLGVEGKITFYQECEGSSIYINGTVSGLTPGQHGIHVHEFGDTSNGCISAGEHYNPRYREHGSPLDVERHIGDLGNIEVLSNGVSTISIRDTVMSLFGMFSVMGRTIVIHADRDDYGRGNFSDSKTTGHSGKRVGCGIIAKI